MSPSSSPPSSALPFTMFALAWRCSFICYSSKCNAHSFEQFETTKHEIGIQMYSISHLNNTKYGQNNVYFVSSQMWLLMKKLVECGPTIWSDVHVWPCAYQERAPKPSEIVSLHMWSECEETCNKHRLMWRGEGNELAWLRALLGSELT